MTRVRRSRTPGPARFGAPQERGRSRRTRPPIEEVAGVAQRLAVLLSAGVPPPAAWRYVEGSSLPPATAVVVSAATRAASEGADVAGAIRSAQDEGAARRAGADRRSARGDGTAPAWGALAAVWSVAIEVGAPLASSLREMAASFRATGRIQREALVALAGPRATARLVSFLPLLAVAFGGLLGFDTVGVLFTTPAGGACLALGTVLMILGSRWSSGLVRRAGRPRPVPGLDLELVAIALAGGVSLDRAREVAERALERFAPAPSALSSGTEFQGPNPTGRDADAARIDAVLALARAAGIPAAELLRAEADELRLSEQTRAQEGAARLGVHLMIPLAVCVLPAFMLLGVAPMLLAVVSSTVTGF